MNNHNSLSDLALREAEPPALTDQSTVADKASREKWDHSNKVCLMVMKYTMEIDMTKK